MPEPTQRRPYACRARGVTKRNVPKVTPLSTRPTPTPDDQRGCRDNATAVESSHLLRMAQGVENIWAKAARQGRANLPQRLENREEQFRQFARHRGHWPVGKL